MLRALCGIEEAVLLLVLAGSLVFIDSVWDGAPFVRRAMAALLCLLLGCRIGLVWALRKRLGNRKVAIEALSRRILIDPGAGSRTPAWTFDLARPLLPAGPLLLPGLIFLAWIGLQLVPVPATATLSFAHTIRGLSFVALALLAHVSAAAAFSGPGSRQRITRGIAGLGLVVASVQLFRIAFPNALEDGFFEPSIEADNVFLNRNHFGTYMLTVVPLSFAVLASAFRAYARRVGHVGSIRRRLEALAEREGTALLYASVPALACVSALIATLSRGAVLAGAAGLVVAAVSAKRRLPLWSCAVAFAVMAMSWLGLERLESRFERMREDAPGRTWVWADTLSRMDERWMTGYGFNTFEIAMSRATLWALPAGATPWTGPYETALVGVDRVGIRSDSSAADIGWYADAHNDYVQVLAETGLIGLLIVLWAASRAFAAARGEPWLLAAVTGVLLHAMVDSGLQVPAAALLFSVVAAMPRPANRS